MNRPETPILELAKQCGYSLIIGGLIAWEGRTSFLIMTIIITPGLIWLNKGAPRCRPRALTLRPGWAYWWLLISRFIFLVGLSTWAFSRDLQLALLAGLFMTVWFIVASWEDWAAEFDLERDSSE